MCISSSSVSRSRYQSSSSSLSASPTPPPPSKSQYEEREAEIENTQPVSVYESSSSSFTGSVKDKLRDSTDGSKVVLQSYSYSFKDNLTDYNPYDLNPYKPPITGVSKRTNPGLSVMIYFSFTLVRVSYISVNACSVD